jgi:hypothetical protein
LKHGCQELLFFHMSATAAGGAIEWPLDIVRIPAFAYRGTYMLPCWAAHDSFESWARVLRFNSELTLNRSWFWLAGFPVAGHPGEYGGTDLADPAKVQGLFDLAASEDTKILIGGGWFNWHHGKAVGNDLRKGIQYFFRERCWDLELDEPAFVARLHRRLFDADAPAEAGARYWQLSHLAFAASRKEAPAPEALAPIRSLVEAMSARGWTARTEDTLARMREALVGLEKPGEKK